MRIAWIADPNLLEFTADDMGSRLASYRYRMLIPRGVLQQLGHGVKVIALGAGPFGLGQAVEDMQGADVAIFGKTSHWELNERLLAAARISNVATVADFCDDYFGHNHRMGEHFRVMALQSDAISVSTPFLAKRVTEVTSRDATVIADPYEGPKGAPKWAPGRQLQVLWFGHYLNFPGLQKSLDAILSAGMPMRVVVMTMNKPDVVEWCAANSSPAQGCAVEFREWSLAATWQALRDCDVTVLPIDRTQPMNLSKGPNRVVESLWAGRFAVANPVPAYEEFGAWAWVGNEISAGLRWAVENPADVVERIKRAQKDILHRFSPQAIARSWEKLLKSARHGRSFSARARQS
jgi:glycosyltransferase involved in cell wall biosynthesis